MEFIEKNRGKVAGMALGLVFGWFAITYGVFKAIFVSLCIAAGYFIGKRLDEQVGFKDILSGWFREK
jgi:uncharacterized membrane protein